MVWAESQWFDLLHQRVKKVYKKQAREGPATLKIQAFVLFQLATIMKL